jgi:hypothetical protein
MEAQLIAAIIWVIVMGVGGIAGMLRLKRRQEAASVAARAGLQYSAADPFDCARVSFHLFRKGDGRGADNVMWWEPGDGHVFRVFDYWFYDEHRDQYGRTSKTYHRSTCAMALVGSAWPEIQIVREGIAAKMLSHVAGGDIDFESEEFNRTFAVHCPDRRFASALIDPQMLELLLSTKGELNFELKGRWLLVWTSPIAPKLMPGLLRVAEQFVATIPKVVWELYPSDFVDAAGKPLPAGDDPVARAEAELALASAGHDDGPFEVLAHSPFEALERHDGVEYDLDGHVLPQVKEDPWGTGRG